jgi:rubrerythrin
LLNGRLGYLVNRDDLVQYIYCSTIFEEEVAKAYQKISEKISDKEVAHLLEFIAKDSFKHASALKALNAQLANRTDQSYGDCRTFLGEVWAHIVEEARRYATREGEVTLSELNKILQDFENYEGYASEEYLTILYAEVIKLLAKEYHLDLQEYKIILEWIIEDERRHNKLLSFIRNKIADKLGEAHPSGPTA